MSALDKFDQYKALKVSPVTVNEWGGETVYVREMNAEAMQEFLSLSRDDSEEFSIDHACRVIALHLCDEDGNLEFSRDEREEAARSLSEHKYQVVTFLFAEALKTSGLATEEIEEAAGN